MGCANDRAFDALYQAIEEAKDAGWSPAKFLRETRTVWAEVTRERQASDDRTLEKVVS